MKKPTAWLGLINPKSPENVGMVMRAAGCYEAAGVFYTGERFHRARQFFTDTKNMHEKIPLKHQAFLPDAVPGDVKIVVIELIEGATPLMDFVHPEQALYIFGPEDGSVDQQVLDRCDQVVYIPTVGCMNLAASVNVVLYDRLAKAPGDAVAARPISENRDTNSRAKIRRGDTE